MTETPKFKSFADPSKIEGEIREHRADKQRAEEDAKKKAEAEAAAAAEAEADQSPEAVAERGSLRERALSERGVFSVEMNKRLLPEEFLARFKDLNDAIRDKKFLLNGYASITRKVWDVPVVIKTPTQTEYAAIQSLSEGRPNPVTGAASYNMAEQSRWMLVFMVQEWGAETFPVPKAPRTFESQRFAVDKEKALKDFVANEQVQTKLKFFEDLPMPVYERLAAMCVDVAAVMFLALRADAENP